MLPAGSRLGPYEILAPLGAGGMGEVYRAHDSKLGRDVAIKVLPARSGRAMVSLRNIQAFKNVYLTEGHMRQRIMA